MKTEHLIREPQHALPKAFSRYGLAAFQVLLGSLFLGLMAQISLPLPFTPVPMSMQTLGVALLAITLGPRKGVMAVAAYLLQATLGLPVLAGGLVNPLWMIGPKAGYLIGFALSAFVVGELMGRKQERSFIQSWLILSLNEGITLLMGSLWLGYFVGWDYAFAMGAFPFLPGALVKITIAASALKPIVWLKSNK